MLGNAWLLGFWANDLFFLDPRVITATAKTLEGRARVPVALLAASLIVLEGVRLVAVRPGHNSWKIQVQIYLKPT